MDRPDELQIILTRHEIKAELANGIVCPNGKVLVEMLPPAHELRGILLPDTVAEQYRPDIGIVLSCGPDVTLAPGDMVAVRAYDGQWLEGFEAGGYQTQNQVRVYGHYSPAMGEVHESPWQVSIPILIFDDTLDMQATHKNLIVRRDPAVMAEGMLELTGSLVYRTGLATVESIGPRCSLSTRFGDIQVGDRIHYETRGELEFSFGGDPDLAVIPDTAVNFKIQEAIAV